MPLKHIITSWLPSSFSQCLPCHLSWSLHSIISLTSFLDLFLLHVHTISILLFSSCLQCLPPLIFWSHHIIISLTSSPSSLLITCSYHLNLASLIFSAMSITSHLLPPPPSSTENFHQTQCSLHYLDKSIYLRCYSVDFPWTDILRSVHRRWQLLPSTYLGSGWQCACQSALYWLR